MKILVCHNFYQEPGGEDRVFADEAELLRRHGHDVQCYSAHNASIGSGNRLALAGRAVWNRQTHRELSELVRRHQSDIVHFHNTFPLISPAAYHAAASQGAAVVQTLHNYRLLCANAVFFRDGKRCESCLGKTVAWAGVAHGCYRGSRCATAASAAVTSIHRAIGTWRNAVHAYIAPTHFAREKFVAGGLPEQKIVVKPNFILDDPGVGPGDGGYALFVGRLSAEKGFPTLLAAYRQLQTKIPLKIAGDGPMRPEIAQAQASGMNIEWLGKLTPREIDQLMQRAMFLVVPSECYETFGRVAIEALAVGTPVIASSGGALSEIIADEITGLHFRGDNATDLAAKIGRLTDDVHVRTKMRCAARAAFLAQYTANENYSKLQTVYAAVANQNRLAA
jgi:glycosyltransferase involved in cell wall biosynthesis